MKCKLDTFDGMSKTKLVMLFVLSLVMVLVSVVPVVILDHYTNSSILVVIIGAPWIVLCRWILEKISEAIL